MSNRPYKQSVVCVDFETRSECDLKTHGAWAYAHHETTEALMCAWRDLTDPEGKTHLAVGEEAIRLIPGLFDPEVTKIAHNAQFERYILKGRFGDTQPVESFYDTAAQAVIYGYPRHLGELAKALGVAEKDTAGTRLINLFSKPKKGGGFHDALDRTEDFLAFCNYCIQDVDTTVEVYEKLSTAPYLMTPTERDVYHLCERINDRGVPVDVELSTLSAQAATEIQARDKAEIERLTGVANANSVQQLRAWLAEQGVETPKLDKATVDELLAQGVGDDTVKKVLTLKRELALGSLARFQTIADYGSVDGKAHGIFLYYGAHTGRAAGRGVQPHNLPRDSFASDDEVLENITAIKSGETLDKTSYKKLLRSTFDGGEHGWIVSDFSAIEARVVAWLAGEQWVLDAFADGKDIYIETASQMYNLLYEEAREYRKQGKVATLGFGFGGGVNALRAFGYECTDEEGWELVTAWRKANPRIVKWWAQLEHAFIYGGQAGQFISVIKRDDKRFVKLPSGRFMVYRNVEVSKRQGKTHITFVQGSGKKDHTYSGRLAENCIAGDAEVLTEKRGWIRLDDLRDTDKIYDGFEFVTHSGVQYKGVQKTINLWGVRGTPEHQVKTTKGWKRFDEATRYHREKVQPANSSQKDRRKTWELLANAMRMRKHKRSPSIHGEAERF